MTRSHLDIPTFCEDITTSWHTICDWQKAGNRLLVRGKAACFKDIQWWALYAGEAVWLRGRLPGLFNWLHVTLNNDVAEKGSRQ